MPVCCTNTETFAVHISSPATTGWASTNSVSIMVDADVGDYFEVYGQQGSGDGGRYAIGGKAIYLFQRLPT